MRVRTPIAVAATVLSLALASACTVDEGGGSGGDVEAGSIETVDGLDGATVTVGSKEFDEQLLLGQIAIVALEAAGAEPEDRTNITGSDNVRKALTAGEIDLYWEYTGTAWVSYLQQSRQVADPTQLFDEVAKADAANDVTWWALSPANNTYAIAANPDVAQEQGIETISDYAALVKSDPSAAATCIGSEFASRDDGFPGVQETYGFQLPTAQRKEVNDAVVYPSVGKGETCAFGSVAATDGRVKAQDLVLLEDDQGFFPVYSPAISIRAEVAEEYPGLEEVFAPIAEKLTSETLTALNEQVSVDGVDADQVARDWMQQEGFIG